MSYIAAKISTALMPVVLCSLIAGCGGGGGYSSSSSSYSSSTPTYSLGGMVSGLASSTNVVLLNELYDSVTVSADGTFSFPTLLSSGNTFYVTISSNPSGEICSVGGTSNGVIGTSSVSTVAVACSPTAATVSTFAGHAGTAGSADGTGTLAYFNKPIDIAVDSAGNAYVTDAGNNTIRKITSAGAVTTLAGSPGVVGSADGTGASATFSLPTGVAVDSSGNVYVSDAVNQTIRKITPAGVVTTVAGQTGVTGSADGTGTAATFHNPAGIAIDASGNLFVVDSGNDTIRKITPGGVVSTVAGSAGTAGFADGTGSAATFNLPAGIAVDASGNLYVTDSSNTVRKITSAGVVTTLAGTAQTMGAADGTGAAASFNAIGMIAIDGSGNLYIADRGNATVRKITPAGVVTTVAGTVGKLGTTDGNAGAATFNSPFGIAVDTSGNLYVGDYDNHAIRKIVP